MEINGRPDAARGGEIYDFSTREHREKAAAFLFAYAKSARAVREREWDRFDRYYEGRHGEQGLCVPDAYIHVESQIEPEVPDFHLRVRGGAEAPSREAAVKQVVFANRLDCRNTANERRLLKYGDAFWKLRWDQSVEYPGAVDGGDVCVEDVDPRQIYPDPTARELQEGEFVIHAYPMHRRKAARAFAQDLERMGTTAEALLEQAGSFAAGNLYRPDCLAGQEECLGVTELYYRTDDDRIGLCVLLCGREIRHVPDFWQRTGGKNRLFPFVQYWRIRNENSLWNRSELEPLIPLIDAADRELWLAERNRAFMANDMLVIEEDALAEGCELSNEPGAILTMRPGRFDRVRRLSGLNSAGDGLDVMERYTALIERTAGNFDSTLGEEPERVTTASGIQILNARADARRDIKRADRLRGFERLYGLIDWFCLEFYDDGRCLSVLKDGETPMYYMPEGEEAIPPVDCILVEKGGRADDNGADDGAL